MGNPFGADEIAAGYATSRPAVHPRILEMVAARMGWKERFARALDVGCGAGVSTSALGPYARQLIGLDPAESMLRWAWTTAPSAVFVAGRAEAIPLGAGTVDVMTAAGSLNYADPDRFFPEALRVLTAKGVLVVYDFAAGICFREGAGLEEWFAEFSRRYPPPAHEARALDPEMLARFDCGLKVREQQRFEIGIRLEPDFYLDYMMTETNVAAAIRNGVARAEIKSWCAGTLEPVWQGLEREVVFRGYFACMTR